MRWTLKDCLKNCSMALKKMPGKRGKWVRDWPGQVSVCARIPFCICVTFTFMHLADETTYSAFGLYIFYQYVCSL